MSASLTDHLVVPVAPAVVDRLARAVDRRDSVIACRHGGGGIRQSPPAIVHRGSSPTGNDRSSRFRVPRRGSGEVYVVVVGAGDIGTPLIDIATRSGDEVVVIERDDQRASRVAAEYDCLVLNTDATTKESLIDASRRSSLSSTGGGTARCRSSRRDFL